MVPRCPREPRLEERGTWCWPTQLWLTLHTALSQTPLLTITDSASALLERGVAGGRGTSTLLASLLAGGRAEVTLSIQQSTRPGQDNAKGPKECPWTSKAKRCSMTQTASSQLAYIRRETKGR